MGSVKEEPKRVHVMVVPHPIQGHINPLLRFAKRLVQTGKVTVSFVTTERIRETISKANPNSSLLKPDSSFRIELFSDGEVTVPDVSDDNCTKVKESMQHHGSKTLSKLIERLNSEGPVVSCIVYDSLLCWIPDLSAQFGVPSAFFWTQSCALYSIYYDVVFPKAEGGIVLEEEAKPTFLQPSNTLNVLKNWVLEQLHALGKVKWIFGNSFDQLERKEMLSVCPEHRIANVGPLVPSAYLEGRIPEDTDDDAHLWKVSDQCTEWLDNKPPQSVVYMSFGSLAELSKEQVTEFAYGIQRSGYPFIWVLRPPRSGGDVELPEGFIEETADRGLIVPWCSQIQVLSHPSIGMFLSHCGWNSALEGVSQGVPILAFPQWSDQPTTAMYMEKVWKNGIRLQKDVGEGMLREEVEKYIKFLMESDKGMEIRKNAQHLGEVARHAMTEGGSSDINIQKFVDDLSLVSSV